MECFNKKKTKIYPKKDENKNFKMMKKIHVNFKRENNILDLKKKILLKSA